MVAFLMLVWLGFSDKHDAFHLLAGLASAVLVAVLTHPVVATGSRRTAAGRLVTRYVYTFRWRMLAVFVPWLVGKIVSANIDVARRILSPRLPVQPGLIRVRTGLSGDLSRTALAAAITLTPGTCVVDIVGDEFVIHRIHPDASAGIVEEMIPMVRRCFEASDEAEGA